MSSRVLCATLAVPIPPSRSRIDSLIELDEQTVEKKKRLSTLLSLKEPPTRSSLARDLVCSTHPHMLLSAFRHCIGEFRFR